MDPNPLNRVVDLDNPADLDALAAAVRGWEPRLDLHRPPRDALLYEPDGTLYAVCLGDGLTFATDRREQAIHRGDAVVVPQAFAVDAGPGVDLLALRDSGPPPDHFRERFIQVWGFEHFPAPPADPGRAGLTEVIAASDVRHRVPYAVIDVNLTDDDVNLASDDVLVLVGLTGTLTLTIEAPTGTLAAGLRPGSALGLAPGTSCVVRGEGRAGVLSVVNEVTHEARRNCLGRSDPAITSPEYRPNGLKP